MAESKAYEERIAAEFSKDVFNMMDVFDCSHIHFSSACCSPNLPGFCLDIGAPRSVVGQKGLHKILAFVGKTTILVIKPCHSFRFGEVAAKSLSLVELSLQTPNNIPNIKVLLDVVPVNISALLGLEVLDSEESCADNVINRLVHRKVLSRSCDSMEYQDIWSVPIIRQDGHLYSSMCFSVSTFYITVQLWKLHRNFAHPSAEKLYNLLERAGLESVTSETLERLKGIVASCEPCQGNRNAPLRFRVIIGHENVRFNARALIDIMYLDGKPALHIVDEVTRFSAARFLAKMSTEAVQEAIVLCWSSVYTGLPDNIIVDEGSQFRKLFAELAVLHDVNLEKSGVESHNSLGIGERSTSRSTTRTGSSRSTTPRCNVSFYWPSPSKQ